MKSESHVIRRRIEFSGRVQGVGFRATARDCALTGDVSGWVRNEPDGSVAMEIQGLSHEVEAVLGLLRSRMGLKISAERCTTMEVSEGEREFVIAR
jgi:acylphosphatase